MALYMSLKINPPNVNKDEGEFDEILAVLRDRWQPCNTAEDLIVQELAASYWRPRRA